ncbi:hypothetical protein HID58_035074 [Brassica napus]|uniref:Uncharacterized protein n=1 Tax=Brassica napus TaxID=3708 RepID=A0ABQ8C567_BRANA|nr:hypothetical protein HID58_035074 [Brassica napus]
MHHRHKLSSTRLPPSLLYINLHLPLKPRKRQRVVARTRLMYNPVSTGGTDSELIDLLFFAGSCSSSAVGFPSEHFRLSVEFQWFFTALSVRPLRRRAIVAHLLPNLARAETIVSSSSAENGRCSTSGDS